MSEYISQQGNLEIRRKRAQYRATYRGTKEMDWLLGKYAEARLDGMTEADLASFEQILVLPDPDLHQWILDPALAAGNELSPLINDIHDFHGLPGQGRS